MVDSQYAALWVGDMGSMAMAAGCDQWRCGAWKRLGLVFPMLNAYNSQHTILLFAHTQCCLLYNTVLLLLCYCYMDWLVSALGYAIPCFAAVLYSTLYTQKKFNVGAGRLLWFACFSSTRWLRFAYCALCSCVLAGPVFVQFRLRRCV